MKIPWLASAKRSGVLHKVARCILVAIDKSMKHGVFAKWVSKVKIPWLVITKRFEYWLRYCMSDWNWIRKDQSVDWFWILDFGFGGFSGDGFPRISRHTDYDVVDFQQIFVYSANYRKGIFGCFLAIFQKSWTNFHFHSTIFSFFHIYFSPYYKVINTNKSSTKV